MEDDVEQTILLTGITDGDGGQPTSISVVSDNPSLFSTLKTATDTTLVYQTASDANGRAVITVSVTDADGT